MSSRRSMPKVRSGCSTCKIRRVKCDEQKPSCARCIRAGRECKGYPISEKNSVLHDGEGSLNLPIKAYSIPFKVPGSRTDRQLLHFYCSNAAGNIAGFSDRELWTRLILQRCHDQSIIRNAVVTLSSIYLDHVRGEYYYADIGCSPPTKSLEQITKCHRQLMTHLGSPNASLETALICSLLFHTFETLLGNKHQALFHLDQGLVLLKRYQAERNNQHTPSSEELCTHITAQLSRLDVKASRSNPARAPLLKLVSQPEISGTVSVVPDIFFSPTHAEAVLTKLENWMVHQVMAHSVYGPGSIENVHLQAIYEKEVLVGQFEKFHAGIDKLVKYCRSQDPTWISHALLLQISSRLYYYALIQNSPTSDLESPCPNREDFEKNLQDTVYDIERLLSNFKEPHQFPDHRYFSLSSTFLSLLARVILKTTNRNTLEKAVSLMKHDRLPSREGLADSKAMEFIFRKLQSQLLEKHFRSDDNQHFDTNIEHLNVSSICNSPNFDGMFMYMQSEEAENELW